MDGPWEAVATLSRRRFVSRVGTCGLILALPRRSRAATTLRFSTWMGASSPLGKVLQAWTTSVDKKTGGSLKVGWTWRHGDWESRVVQKLQRGDLDAAMLRRPALDAYTDALSLLELPGGVTSWTELAAARARVDATVRAETADHGGVHLCAADLGLRRLLADRPIRVPGDLAGVRTYVPLRDPLTRAEVAVLKYRKLELPDTDLAKALLDDVVDVEPLAPFLMGTGGTHIHEWVWGASVGMLVANASRLGALSPEHRAVITTTAAKAGAMLTERVRKAEQDRMEQLERRLTVVKMRDPDRAEWNRVFSEISGRLEKKQARHLKLLKTLQTYQTMESL